MHRSPVITAFLALASSSIPAEQLYRLPPEKKGKHCLHCGTKHTHNNSFCSAECCREYRAEVRS